MHKNKIFVDCRMVHSSGIGTYLRNVLSRLIQERPDWQFKLLGDPKILLQEAWSHTANVAVMQYTAPIYGLAEQVRWLPFQPSADLLWVPHYNIPLAWRGPLLATVHDVAHLALAQHARNWAKRFYAKALLQAVRRRADGIIFVSDFTRSEFLRLVGRPTRQSWKISEGVDPEWRVAQRENRTSKPYVVFVGNIKPHKNLLRLLNAFGAICGDFPHDLVLVGKQSGFITGDERIAEAASSMGGRVRFTGQVGDAEVRSLVAGADVLVMPSYYEGFGLPVVEAMACGCPVLAASAASLPEVGGDAVAYCDPFDVGDMAAALSRLLADSTLRAEMSRLGRIRAAAFDWDDVARKTADAISLTLRTAG